MATPRMRPTLAFVVLCGLTGCVNSAVVTRRVALAPSPGAPPALRGAPGIALAARVAFAAPTEGATGSGIAVPTFQPEASTVIRLLDRLYLSADVVFVQSASTYSVRRDAPRVGDSSAGLMLGVGYDQPLFRGFGVHGSFEAGPSVIQVSTVTTAGTSTSYGTLLPMARSALAPYFEWGDLRVYAAGSIGTDVWSDPLSMTTALGGDNGRTQVRAVGMVGAGARFRPDPALSVAVELWLPLSNAGVQHAPQMTIALHFGNFDVKPRPREVESEAPAAPLPPPPLEAAQPAVPL